MRNDRLATYGTAAALAASALVPVLALLPFGWLWLWERGFILYWFSGALLVSLAVFGARSSLVRRFRQLEDLRAPTCPVDDGAPREVAARQAVEAIAAQVDPAVLICSEAAIALGVETVEAVARHMHPGDQDPVWNFTVPEALALIEQVSRKLRPLFVANIPLGDQLTVGQAMRLYRWRKVVDAAERAYDVWRIIRLLNPLTAATQEIRERLSKAAYASLRDEVAKRIAAAYVREVGSAAIDLYSGRLRLTEEEISRHVSAATHADRAAAPAMAEPLRFLLAGQTNAGKSSLINALASEVRAAVDALPATRSFASYEIQPEGQAPVLLIDSPGIGQVADFARLAEKAADCDLLIWVAAANRADRALDRAALAAVKAHFAENPQRRLPPIMLVLSHIDRLPPLQDWAPPYDVATPDTAKARTIRDAMEAAAGDIGVQLADTVPICVAPGRPPYNVDAVWAWVIEALPAAKSAQLLRCVSDSAPGLDWRRLMGQAVGAGRLVVDTLMRRTAS